MTSENVYDIVVESSSWGFMKVDRTVMAHE